MKVAWFYGRSMYAVEAVRWVFTAMCRIVNTISMRISDRGFHSGYSKWLYRREEAIQKSQDKENPKKHVIV